MEVLNEPRAFAVPCDAERSGHDLADDASDVVAIFVRSHAIGRVGVVHDEVDDLAGRLEEGIGCLSNPDAELLLDGREEFFECPGHPISRGAWWGERWHGVDGWVLACERVIALECRRSRGGEQPLCNRRCRRLPLESVFTKHDRP